MAESTSNEQISSQSQILESDTGEVAVSLEEQKVTESSVSLAGKKKKGGGLAKKVRQQCKKQSLEKSAESEKDAGSGDQAQGLAETLQEFDDNEGIDGASGENENNLENGQIRFDPPEVNVGQAEYMDSGSYQKMQDEQEEVES